MEKAQEIGYNMEPFALTTSVSGKEHTEIAKYTHPNITKYCEKFNIDFISINGSNKKIPHFRKFDVLDLVKNRKRFGYIDTDILVSNNAINIFDEVPENHLGVRIEEPVIHTNSFLYLKEILSEYTIGGRKVKDVTWDGVYFNSGVMVMDEASSITYSITNELESLFEHWIAEQDLFNLIRLVKNIPIYDIGNRFNGYHCKPQQNEDVYFYHYLWKENRIKEIEKDSKIIEEQQNAF